MQVHIRARCSKLMALLIKPIALKTVKTPSSFGRSECNRVKEMLNFHIILKCFSFGTPKTINFPFVPNGKLIDFRCPNIQAHHNLAVMCLKFGTPKNDKFPFGTNGKSIILGVPILKHFTVYIKTLLFFVEKKCKELLPCILPHLIL